MGRRRILCAKDREDIVESIATPKSFVLLKSLTGMASTLEVRPLIIGVIIRTLFLEDDSS